MKLKNLILPLLFFSLLCSLIACTKKSKDDPFISLRSRKARLVGKWQLTSGTSENTTVISDSLGRREQKRITTYKKNTYQSVDVGAYQNSNTGVFSHTMEFKKDGGFNSVQIQNNTNTTDLEGIWNFKMGTGDYKNKEQIVINLNSNTRTSSFGYTTLVYESTFTGNKSDMTYTLKELRNKKLVLVSEFTSTDAKGNSNSFKSELTFEQ